MTHLFIKPQLQLFAEDGNDQKDNKDSPNEVLLLEKIKKLETRIDEQDKVIKSVTDFNRRLLDGAKPETKESSTDAKKKLEAYLNE